MMEEKGKRKGNLYRVEFVNNDDFFSEEIKDKEFDSDKDAVRYGIDGILSKEGQHVLIFRFRTRDSCGILEIVDKIYQDDIEDRKSYWGLNDSRI